MRAMTLQLVLKSHDTESHVVEMTRALVAADHLPGRCLVEVVGPEWDDVARFVVDGGEVRMTGLKGSTLSYRQPRKDVRRFSSADLSAWLDVDPLDHDDY